MTSSSPPPATLVPREGDTYLDNEGRHWRVEEVISSDQLEGFYLVRLRYGASPQAQDGTLMLGRREFQALCRERGLRATA